MRWFYVDKETQDNKGPFKEAEFAKLFQDGVIDEDVFVWNGKTVKDWKQLKKVDGLVMALQNNNDPRKGKSRFSWSVGDTLYVMERRKIYEAVVAKVRNDEMKIQYVGYPSKFDEWIKMNSHRIQSNVSRNSSKKRRPESVEETVKQITDDIEPESVQDLADATREDLISIIKDLRIEKHKIQQNADALAEDKEAVRQKLKDLQEVVIDRQTLRQLKKEIKANREKLEQQNNEIRVTDISTDLKVMRCERTDAQKELFSLKDRLTTLQREVTNKTEDMVQRMRHVTGDSHSNKLDDLDAQLEDAFKKADSSRSGSLNLWQFSQAWSALGLGGNEEELKDLFGNSECLGGMSKGMDLRQFLRVVKTHRLAELSLRSRLATLECLFTKLEGGSLGTSMRRRMQRQKIDEEMFDILGKMIDAVLPLTDDALSQGYIAKRDRYIKLREAFNKYDNPKSGALDAAAYKEACRYAGFAGSDGDLMKQFNAVDVDGSGTLDFYEFVISDMGKQASKVGSLSYVKILNKLLGILKEKPYTLPAISMNLMKEAQMETLQNDKAVLIKEKNELEKKQARYDDDRRQLMKAHEVLDRQKGEFLKENNLLKSDNGRLKQKVVDLKQEIFHMQSKLTEKEAQMQKEKEAISNMNGMAPNGGALMTYDTLPKYHSFEPDQFFRCDDSVDFESLEQKIQEIRILEDNLASLRKEYEKFKVESHIREMASVFVCKGIDQKLAEKLVKKGIRSFEDIEFVSDQDMLTELKLDYGERLALQRAKKKIQRKQDNSFAVHGTHVNITTGEASPISTTKKNNVVTTYESYEEEDLEILD